MNSETFCALLEGVSEDYVEEARTCRRRAKGPWLRWTAAAACAVLVLAGALSLPRWEDGIALPPVEGTEEAGTPPGGLSLSLADVPVNQIEAMTDAARLWFDPLLYEEVKWDWEDIVAYLGMEPRVPYVPEGLSPAPGNGATTAIVDKEGKAALDTVWLDYYHDYFPDGSPKLTEEAAARRGFSVRVSKLGLFSDCLYLMPEDERECWRVEGTEVTLGYRSMSHGPYDPETHQPSGYYDLYVAEFTLEGLDWQIVFEQLPLEEVVKVTAGVITGEEEITVLPGPLEHAPRK